MKKLHFLFAALCLILAGACSSDDILEQTPDTPETPEVPDTKGQPITIRASIDAGAIVKAGVVEGNTNYNAGETFYWENGDGIKLIFVKMNGTEETPFDNTTPLLTTILTTKGVILQGDEAEFTGNLPKDLDNGIYNIYACSPNMEQKNLGEWQRSMTSSLHLNQTQDGISSRRLYADGNMELWGEPVKNMTVENGELLDPDNKLKFNMVQLNAMLRFTIDNKMADALTVKQIRIRTEEADGKDLSTFFRTGADHDFSGNAWTNVHVNATSSAMTLTVNNEKNTATIANSETFDAYMCVLPPEAHVLAYDQKFIIEVYLTDAKGKGFIRKGTITNKTSGFDFLYNGGFKAGNRYYFQISLSGNLDPIAVYKVGDFYPGVLYSEGIVCSADASGAQGKILSLDEGKIAWGLNGVTSATDEADGELNTNNAKERVLSIADYPAFAWCVNQQPRNSWYLPARDEMMAVYDVKTKLNNALSGSGNPSVGGMYWTSTASTVGGGEDITNATAFDLTNGTYGPAPRSEEYRVRAMKKFDIARP